ncbi:MAG: hypothetical protein VR64_16570 [Desulfatitalea sp. BRH_c12]|nr:MAG: hypothetical protein VR64_16570 [Desulfatitalea sp. BRH_c12]
MMTQLSGTDFQKCAPVSLTAMLGLDEIAQAPQIRNGNGYFFASPLTAQRLALLNNMVGTRGSMVIVVIGERGSGKTTLMNQFITEKSNRWQMGRIRVKSGKKYGDLLPNLNNRLVFFSREDNPPSVIVDDAHQLSERELKLLLQSAIAADGRRKLQSIVLFAEQPMRDRLTEIANTLPPMAVIDKIFMAPLSEKQTAAYLEHRFRTAGYLKGLPFSKSQIKAIHKVSKGLPGWINDQAVVQLKRLYAGGRRHGLFSLKAWFLPKLPNFRAMGSSHY